MPFLIRNFIGFDGIGSYSKSSSLPFSEFFRSQTTKGIWMAKAHNIEPCTLVMDLEGTDGRERGEVIKKQLFFLICS
jgi:hypothetical protein